MEKHFVVPTIKDMALAREVSGWTIEAGTMLPKTPEQILGLYALGWSVMVGTDGVVVAHAALTFEWPDNWMELGGVVTKKEYRKMGFASLAVEALLSLTKEKYPDKKLFALCNNLSLPLFLGLGGLVMAGSELPDEVWAECKSCPKFKQAKSEGKHCCDTPVNMTQAGVR